MATYSDISPVENHNGRTWQNIACREKQTIFIRCSRAEVNFPAKHVAFRLVLGRLILLWYTYHPSIGLLS